MKRIKKNITPLPDNLNFVIPNNVSLTLNKLNELIGAVNEISAFLDAHTHYHGAHKGHGDNMCSYPVTLDRPD